MSRYKVLRLYNDKHEKVYGIVILYNPNLELLDRLYKTLKNQVDSVIFIDNSEDLAIKKEMNKWLMSIDSSNNIYLDLEKNYGIAYAQNRGIVVAKKRGARFVLLLDQDSALPNNMVRDLLLIYTRLREDGHKVATVGPSFLDEKTDELAKVIRHHNLRVHKSTPNQASSFEVADYIISSGSLISIEVLDKVGNMDERLFIDWVDIEWGMRAKRYGYASYVAPRVIMRHSIGDEYVNFGDKNINLHTDFRNYFIVRNSIYLSLYSQLPLNFRCIQLGKVPLYILFYSYHSKRRLYSFGLLSKAVIDGIFKNMGKGHFK